MNICSLLLQANPKDNGFLSIKKCQDQRDTEDYKIHP